MANDRAHADYLQACIMAARGGYKPPAARAGVKLTPDELAYVESMRKKGAGTKKKPAGKKK